MSEDVGLAKRYFANRAKLIDDLAARDEDFRDLCRDFATAEELRETWARSPAPERDERYAECAELVESLRIEIETALDNTAIIPFPRSRK
ncbi:hypothetical protein [Rhizobium sp. BK251]|uniref:hypothetical protein n=1 Tax=Rhizobium sp. BK251 TaxID=2512125 RepID=UPI00104E27F1|nr:hypothetical protein [Rhizobium sp. BK251]TCL71348.1 hypothetical protein EV286_106324 [Rhizobium sp. BK251]